MFWTRLFSGIGLLVILAGLIYLGGDFLFAGTLLISLIGLFEFYRAIGIEKKYPGYVGYLTLIVYYLLLRFEVPFISIMLLWMTALFALLIHYVFTYPKVNIQEVALSFFGIFYVGVMLSHIYLLRMLPLGIYLVWIIFICSWGCDTCAYCAGRLFGKHKMSPVLSPNKTVEGAIGGLLGVFLITALFCFILKDTLGIHTTHIFGLSAVAAVAGFASMIGDLAASAIKRTYDIKDYGNLIPGHGGILDRFDSVIITAPIVYYLITIVLSGVEL